MKTHQRALGLRRFSASPPLSFPPIISISSSLQDDPKISIPSKTYTKIKNSYNNTCQKFFNLHPQVHSQSPNTDITTCRSAFTSQEVYSPKSSYYSNDIIERIESYEIKLNKKKGLEVLQENYFLWERCLGEVTLELQKHESELGLGIIKLCNHYSDIVRESLRMTCIKNKEDQVKFEDLKRKSERFENENKKLSAELDDIKQSKRLEMEQIEKEIEEIFGKNDVEIQHLKLMSTGYNNTIKKSTADVLSELWMSMNKEEDIPEIKNGDFLGMDPSEIPDLLSKKFLMIHQLTAKRVTEMIRLRKNIRNKECQTSGDYITPQHHEEQTKLVEKLHLQLQNAYVSIEKFKGSSGSKGNIVEALENEKNLLTIELDRYKKELESIKSSFSKTSYQLQKTTAEFADLTKEKESLNTEKLSLTSELLQKTRMIQEITHDSEKLEKSVKDKDDRIQTLEKTLAKRQKKIEVPEEKDQPAPRSKPAQKFDEKEFLNSIKSGSRRRTQDSSMYPDSPARVPHSENLRTDPSSPQSIPPSLNPSLIKTHDTSNPLPNILDPHPIPSESPGHVPPPQKSGINSSTKPSKKPRPSRSPKIKIPEIASLPNKPRISNLAQIDEVSSPIHKGVQRDSEALLEISEKDSRRNSRSNSKSNSKRNSKREISYDAKYEEEEGIHENKPREKSRNSRKSKQSNFLGQTNDDESFYNSRQDSGSESEYLSTPGIDFLPRPRKSRDSNYSSRSRDSKSVEESHKPISTKSTRSQFTGTEELSYMTVTECSKAVQFNCMMPDIEENPSNPAGVYILPYNPNQYYGLRGDAYYHTTHSVFQAQPRIPDLKSSVFFQNSFHKF